MKRLSILIGIFFFTKSTLFAQDQLKNIKGCSFYNEVQYSSINVTKCKDKEILKIIDDILKSISVVSNFEVLEANIQNAMAVEYLGRKLIIIDPAFFKQLKQKFRNNQTLYFIISHELGHHLKSHLQQPSKIHPMWDEIEADQFAGSCMRKLKLEPSTFFDIIDLIAPTMPPPESTHPSWQARMKAAMNGYAYSFFIETKKGIAIPKSALQKDILYHKKKEESELQKILNLNSYNKKPWENNYNYSVQNGVIYRSYLFQEENQSEFKLSKDTIEINSISEIYLRWDDPGEICFRSNNKGIVYYLQNPTIANKFNNDSYFDFSESIQDDFFILMNLYGRIANIQGLKTIK